MKKLIIILILLISVPASADMVVPSSRVTTHLHVREQASAQSQTLSTMRPDESAELIEAIPYWYHVKLSNGTQGFVSKAWSQVVPDADEHIRLGAWNIKKLGHGSSSDFPLIAQVINSNFDILAVVEVMQKQGGHQGYDRLITELGPGWQGQVTATQRPRTSSGQSEFYAVLYRQSLVSPCVGWSTLIYHTENDGSPTGSGPDHFSREPAFGCYVVSMSGIDFLLAAYHAKWAGGNSTEIANEVSHLPEVFTSMTTARPNEGDLLIVGDFNLVPAKLHQTISYADRTNGSGSTLNYLGQRTGNLYDHLIVHDESASSELIGNAEVLDIRNVAADEQTFYSTVSDHLPIVIRMRASGADDD